MKEHYLKYKERWDALSKRDRLALSVGGVAVLMFILYELIWSPYLNAVENLRQRIVDEQKTLQWMQSADQTVKNMQTPASSMQLSPVALLGILQKNINSAGLTGELVSLKQSTGDSVQLSFQKVEFDKLIALLVRVMQEQNVTISQMSVTTDPTPGLVNTEIVLKLG